MAVAVNIHNLRDNQYLIGGKERKRVMSQDGGLKIIIELLSGLYTTASDAQTVIARSGIPSKFIDLNGSPIVIWTRILQEAQKRNAILTLIDIASEDYSDIDWAILRQEIRRSGYHEPHIGTDITWKGPDDSNTLERIIGNQSTLMPISFLETGLKIARAVAKVICPNGNCGTGFLVRDNLFITNNHVIADSKTAEGTIIQFNYQKMVDGTDAQAATFRLNPSKGFATSPSKGGDDWTAVRISGDANSDWGAVPLLQTEAKVNDYVNIIQHPAGMPKQIALYHNLVVFVGENRVQYLTDTLPGSSGSPVFDSNWNVVALHHSGGWLTEPGTRTKRTHFRNEGMAMSGIKLKVREWRFVHSLS
jgi:hypothetical protein